MNIYSVEFQHLDGIPVRKGRGPPPDSSLTMVALQDSTLNHCGHLVIRLPFAEPRHGGLVDCLLHAVPHHGVQMGAELPSGQRLTQGLRLLHNVQ